MYHDPFQDDSKICQKDLKWRKNQHFKKHAIYFLWVLSLQIKWLVCRDLPNSSFSCYRRILPRTSRFWKLFESEVRAETTYLSPTSIQREQHRFLHASSFLPTSKLIFENRYLQTSLPESALDSVRRNDFFSELVYQQVTTHSGYASTSSIMFTYSFVTFHDKNRQRGKWFFLLKDIIHYIDFENNFRWTYYVFFF